MTLTKILTDSKSLVHYSCAGAGVSFQDLLWGPPGASKYLVGCFFAYARTQMNSFLGHEPGESYVSAGTALDMAMASYLRAVEHKVVNDVEGHPVGIGVTAAVASAELPKGEQRAFIAVVTKDRVYADSVYYDKAVGGSARRAQDAVLATRTEDLLTEAVEGREPKSGHEASAEALERFYLYPFFHTNGIRKTPTPDKQRAVYLPATLNPIHEGHRTMARAAEEQLSPSLPGSKIKAVYLVSSSSPHKGSLSVQEMLFKAGMLRAEKWRGESRAVEFTHDEPLFLDKARKRPGSIFIIGADTMERMLDPKWGPGIEDMLSEMRNLDIKFLVMGRFFEGKWQTCRDIKVPWPHGNIFHPLEGRVDLSSTQLREAANG